MCEAKVNKTEWQRYRKPLEIFCCLSAWMNLWEEKAHTHRLNSHFLFLTCSFLGLNIALERSEFSQETPGLGAVRRWCELTELPGGKPAEEEVALSLQSPATDLAASLHLGSCQPAPFPSTVIPGPGAAAGACHHGAGTSGQCPRHLPPGCHALPPGLLLG